MIELIGLAVLLFGTAATRENTMCPLAEGECTFGCADGFYGVNCTQFCNFTIENCKRCSISNTNSGVVCNECSKNFYRENDQKCIGCNSWCTRDSSSPMSTCRENDGYCYHGCSAGRYGSLCGVRCSSTCKDACHRETGHCELGCKYTSYCGPTCELQCQDGCASQHCNQTCECVKGCTPTYWGAQCRAVCNLNCVKPNDSSERVCNTIDGTCIYGCNGTRFWGNHCNESCSKYCLNGTCEQDSGNCTDGCATDTVFGLRCNKQCNENCIGGTCKRADGYCKNDCKVGKHGIECNENCSKNCFNDACTREKGLCTISCKTGFYGDFCNVPCSDKCLNTKCERKSGYCTDGCKVGKYGTKCNENCSENCFNDACTRDKGHCTISCKTGFYGDSCHVPCNDKCLNTKCERKSGYCTDGCHSRYRYLCRSGQTIVRCFENIDSRGLNWPETISGKTIDIRCQEGFTGSISRRCGAYGVWHLQQYNCTRESIVKINEKVSSLNDNTTEEEMDRVLEEIVKVTSSNETTHNNNLLTDGELSVLSTSLEKVASVLETSSGIINETITEKFIEIASNLVDDSNQESWHALSQYGMYDASERLLKSVDSLSHTLIMKEDSGNNGTFIVKKNIAIEVKSVSNKDVIFPDPTKDVPDKADENADWFKESNSSLRLDPNALINTSMTYTTTAVVYRDLSKILPNKRNNDTNESPDNSESIISAPILSMTISPPVAYKLDPPVRLKFTHNQINYTEPWCGFWVFTNGKYGQGFWSSEGCVVKTKNAMYTISTISAETKILRSAKADVSSKALRIISMVGIGISIACLAVTLIVYLCLWRYLRNDRTTALLHLCAALLLSYILFLAGVDRTENSVACTVIAAMLHYIYLVVFCIMLVEGVEIAITVIYVFKTKSRITVMLVFAWVIPAIIVGISLSVTQADGYGNDNFCWLSVDNEVIWAFVGPALLIITFNAFCLLIVIRVMFKTTAMATKTALEKIKTSFRALCVLVPVIGVSWILGIFYMNESLYFIQYVFAVLNGLQGFFIFLIHCLLNTQVKAAIRNIRRRRSSAKVIFLTNSRDDKRSNDFRGRALTGDTPHEMKSSIVDSSVSDQMDNKVGEN